MEDGIARSMGISDGIPAVPITEKSQNSVPNPSAEEKTTQKSIPLNKNRRISMNYILNPPRKRK
jgi:hypothetical protein